jgi:hypothetical protein
LFERGAYRIGHEPYMKQVLNKKVLTMLFLVLTFAGLIAWRVAACYIANAELKSDMKYLCRQLSVTTGLADPLTEDQLRDAVVKNAKDDGIELNRDQVTVEKTATRTESTVHLAVDYDGKIDLFVLTMNPHFSLNSSDTVYLPAQ